MFERNYDISPIELAKVFDVSLSGVSFALKALINRAWLS